MARFTLVVRPDGQAILATTEDLPKPAREHLLEMIGRWAHGQFPVAVLLDCEVVQVASLELDLEPAEATA
jgi:hypothetical protein